jgi:hypothetical protein
VATEKILWDGRVKGEQESRLMVAQRIEELRRERRLWYLLPLISVPLSMLPLTVFFYLAMRVAKGRASFVKVLAVVVWSFIIYRGVGGLVTIAARLIRGPERFFPGAPESWSPTSLATIRVASKVAMDMAVVNQRCSCVWRKFCTYWRMRQELLP